RRVALVHDRAHDDVRAGAHAALAGVGLRARVPVVAHHPVGLGGIAAHAVHGAARARVVARVERRADHGAPAHAYAGLADVALRAGVAVAARRARELGARAVRGRARGHAARLAVAGDAAAARRVAADAVDAVAAQAVRGLRAPRAIQARGERLRAC